MTRASGGIDSAGISTPRISEPTRSEKAATKAPFKTTGTARPKKSGSRGAGLTRIAPSVFWNFSPPTSCIIANKHGTAAYWIAFPTT